MEFLRLEKIEFGGVRGQALSDLVLQMFNDFTDLMTKFQGCPEDPADINNNVR